MRSFDTDRPAENIRVSRAETLEELDEIQRVRYEVYAAEMGLDLSGVDHDQKRMVEELDVMAIHLIARVGDELTGSVRINVNRVPAGLESILETAKLPRPFAYCARLYIKKEWRGGGVMNALTKASFEEFERLNSVAAICHCYPRLLNLYKRMGFRPYSRAFVQPGLSHLGWQKPLMCVLRPEAMVRLA